MKSSITVILSLLFSSLIHLANASQADSTTINIVGQAPGRTAFISNVTLSASDTTVISNIRFSILPKPGSVTHPLSATYSNAYLAGRGDLDSTTGQIIVPVYGLYAGYTNTVTLTYNFLDGSSKQANTIITTAAFSDQCGYNTPTLLQPRDPTKKLSYDYMLVKGACSTNSPAILDTDGALRWVGATGFSSSIGGFFDNAVYFAYGPDLYRLDLDGTITLIADYSGIGVRDFHHNIDRGKTGIILDVDTTSYEESTNIEVDASGKLIKRWDLAAIISAAMTAGGDDPTQFVAPSPADWFHNNAVAYNRADDSLIISSRENFLICIDYETSAIKWILGDTTKKWYQFPSLRKFALSLAPGSLPPIGQHGVSITYDQNVMVFDNGTASDFEVPAGANRHYASPRKYSINLATRVATEVWNYPLNETVYSPFCGSVYEDAPFNYIVDYAIVNGVGATNPYAQLLGLDAAGEIAFYYQYPTTPCAVAFNTVPLHLEDTAFPTVGPQALNLSIRGTVGSGNNALIAGFIVNGTDKKTVVLRALGPSLAALHIPDVVSDPELSVYDSTGKLVVTNDNWQTDLGSTFLTTNGLAPTNPAEAATLQFLSPGAYTAVVTSKGDSGVGLVEAYDLSPTLASRLANVSARGMIDSGAGTLISGFIVGEVASESVVIRVLGPSLAASGVSNPLADPSFTVFDSNGTAIAANDNWQDDISAVDIQKNHLAPGNPAESATILHLPAGSYTTIIRGAGDSTGTGLLEVYDLP